MFDISYYFSTSVTVCKSTVNNNQHQHIVTLIKQYIKNVIATAPSIIAALL